MKKNILKLLIPIFLMLVGAAHAQNRDSVQMRKDSAQIHRNDWKFAAGVTLLNNANYGMWREASQIHKLYHPIELNFRYSINGKHVFRLGIPFQWRTPTELRLGISTYFQTESPKELMTIIEQSHYAAGYTALGCDIQFFGVNVGYDYNYHISRFFSAFAGIDLSYYNANINSKYFLISFNVEQSNAGKISGIDFDKVNSSNDIFALQPLAGIRGTFRNLMLEASIGYYFSKYINDYTDTTVSYLPDFPDDYNESQPRVWHVKTPNPHRQFIYQISLYYTF